MFLRSLRQTCHLCKINCSRKQSTWLSLSHATRNRRMCSGQKLQTHSQQKTTKHSYKPLCCFSTTNLVCKERGRKPGHEENEESIMNMLAESQDEGKEFAYMFFFFNFKRKLDFLILNIAFSKCCSVCRNTYK